ncbi:hypothetical protein M595_2957 [Lyngbya aestuarii BL J]|uniref:Isopropylmalate/homocitrate/citramalate synthase n=1 Tax=Lyngbya aestuarii BL J TaxID=1348334 RepID=U7QGJ3_9CYAN|nr:hypothetical protein [Lyngbya aestuarii]ERT07094.1 hypothetical protein M595_2957 [Lyngbya aestuarii BL J]
MNERDKFLYPKSRYRGEFSPEHLVFNANIQEFAQKVNYICGLETNGKITPDEAYHRIKELWKQLKSSKKNLHIGEGDSDQNSESPNP